LACDPGSHAHDKGSRQRGDTPTDPGELPSQQVGIDEADEARQNEHPRGIKIFIPAQRAALFDAFDVAAQQRTSV